MLSIHSILLIHNKLHKNRRGFLDSYQVELVACRELVMLGANSRIWMDAPGEPLDLQPLHPSAKILILLNTHLRYRFPEGGCPVPPPLSRTPLDRPLCKALQNPGKNHTNCRRVVSCTLQLPLASIQYNNW